MSQEMPGCTIGGDFCRKVEKPLFELFASPYRSLMRYSHKDYIEWNGTGGCEKLQEEIRSLVRKREAGYPFRAETETLWILPPNGSGRLAWIFEKCELEPLGTIFSGETKQPIPYHVGYHLEIAVGTRSLTYKNTDYADPMANPNVVVEIRGSKV